LLHDKVVFKKGDEDGGSRRARGLQPMQVRHRRILEAGVF
jgi:hypothetical protein